jgi:hypothetical protein
VISTKTNFIDKVAESNLRYHISLADQIIQFAIKVGLFLISVFGNNLNKIPLFKVFYKPTNSLITMHNLAARNGLDLGSTIRKTKSKIEKACFFENFDERVLDLIIVGSGPGGAITAKNANTRNLDFLIIEKGSKFDKSIPSHSVEQMTHHFRHGGQELMLSWPFITFAQGESWGGGSSVNSGLYHEIPAQVRKIWAKQACISEEAIISAERKVANSLKIEKQNSETLGIYELSPIMNMKKILNWQGGVIPRWRRYLDADKYNHFGMTETYLSQTKEEQIVLGHEVDILKIKGDKIEVDIKGEKCNHKLISRSVCLSAGTISTPEILVRSKLARPRDFYFQFHAMVKELAKFHGNVNNLKDIDPHQIWSEDLTLKIGAAVGTPELLTAIMETKGVKGENDFSKICSLYISVPSLGQNGLIRHGRKLTPYFFPNKTMRKSLRGAQDTLKKSIEAVGGKVLGDDSISVSTVHVFGSIPLGKSNLIDSRGNLIGSEKKIFIRDASLLPTHPLVNPQGPLMQLLIALDDQPTE